MEKIRSVYLAGLGARVKMGFSERLKHFGNPQFLPEGWFWLTRSTALKKKALTAITFWGQDLVLYRGEDGVARAVEAYCPHMGAHLCDGKVEGTSVRCPFHYWKFDESGRCEEIPCQKDVKLVKPLRVHTLAERYGLIWIWTGEGRPAEPVPVVPELLGLELDSTLGNTFVKACHPNVVMINAIDAQHFNSVHNLFVDLEMQPDRLSPRTIQFSNTTAIPETSFLLRLIGRFYKTALTYQMTYWYGNTGSVMVGPDFLHFYIIFALRPTLDGRAEGQTILVTKRRRGFSGAIVNPVLLFLTKLVGNYFAKGDTIIFSRIKFNLRTPLRADHAILSFIDHYESQNIADAVWYTGHLHEQARGLAQGQAEQKRDLTFTN